MTSNKIFFLFLIPFLILVHACGTSDTVTVVPDAPRTGTTPDTLPEQDDQFHQLTLGLIDPVKNFDPLFAENLSTKRVLSLIYNGLFTLDRAGNPVQEIATNYTVSDDGREYTITINRDLYFHDSNAFVSGIGRRIHANDVKWALERTAISTVPEYASKLLMNIAGYQSYFIEQRNEYDASKRVIQGVSGIQVRGADTVVIRLKNPDPDFPVKLASPYLFIYPREAVQRGDRGLASRPIGTGYYRFNSLENNRITLTRIDSNREQTPSFNRIDLLYFENESELFQQFARGDIDWIPETGPNTISQILTDEQELVSSYAEQFNLIFNNGYRYTTFHINENSDSNLNWLKRQLSQVTESDLNLLGEIRLEEISFEESPDTLPDEEYYIRLTNNLIAKSAFSQINSSFINPESTFTFLDITVIIPETTLYTRSTDSIHINFLVPEAYWLSVESPILSLHHSYISGVQNSNVPWLLFLKDVQLQDSDR